MSIISLFKSKEKNKEITTNRLNHTKHQGVNHIKSLLIYFV